MKTERVELSSLGFALLGLAHAEPRSGYALRKVFEVTPIGRFSSSPGSIYPALKKLAQAGLIEARRPPASRRSRYHVTAKGKRALSRWLAQPVETEEYDRDPDAVLLRFALLGAVNDVALTARFLESFETAVNQDLARLKGFLRSDAGQALTRHGVLAVEHGVRVREAALRWARQAARAIAVQDP